VISGRLLHQARRRAGLSQTDLARRAGKATSAIGRWERGEVRPSLETLAELVNACGLDLTLGLAPADDHDRVLVLRCLRMAPDERLREMVSAVKALEAMTTATGRMRG
jgi:transcriptional regulator with XRE-family HTH domain